MADGAPSALSSADVDGLTPLHLATAAGLADEGQLLLSKGADAAAADAVGRPAAALSAPTVAGDPREHAGQPMLLLAHPASLLHNAPAGHEADLFTGAAERHAFGQPECAARLRGLLSPAGK